MTDQNEEPELIIDEDWKSKVQREKEEAAARAAAKEEPAGEADGTDVVATESEVVGAPANSAEEQLPPASLPMLIASLGTQAMAAMGMMPGDDGKPLPVNLAFSKHFIDLLGVLEEKTSGNLSDQEKHYLQETLYQLRMAFVEAKKRPRQ
jgi:hypothetical protein